MAATSRPKSSPQFAELEPINKLLHTAPVTSSDYVAHVQALEKKISSYVRSICSMHTQTNSSGELRDKVVVDFYQCLHATADELASIHDHFRLQ